MLKLIIQPVVENSIFHGLEQKLDNGLVTVHARVDENDMLEVEVKDDGCGMEQEQSGSAFVSDKKTESPP